MAVYKRIVVGTDGSDTARRAVHKAALFAHRIGVPLIVGTAYQRPDPGEGGPPSRAVEHRNTPAAFAFQGANDIAGDAAGFAMGRAPGVDVETCVREGDPADVLIDVAASHDPALLVVGNKGMTGSARFLLGSVPNKISHHALSDVLISRTERPGPRQLPQRILIGTDGSQTATRALQRGLELAAALGARVTGLFVGDETRGREVLHEAQSLAGDADVLLDARVVGGDPSEQLVRYGQDHDIVVVGNKGMTGAARFLLGSVPNKVSHHIDTDLLIVRTVG